MKILNEIIDMENGKAQAFKPPGKAVAPRGFKSVFLAGSIEMNKAEEWQTKITKKLLDRFNTITIFNPRRDDWDSAWTQELSDKNFYGQVDWEHEHIVAADFVFIYFQKETKSPISLLELGLAAAAGKKVVVCCPDGFWRKGNVEYICKKYKLDMIDKVDDLVNWLEKQGVK